MHTVVIDSLTKLMSDEAPRPAALIGGFHASGFLGERLSVQIAVRIDPDDESINPERVGPANDSPAVPLTIGVDGALASFAQLSAVRRVPVPVPAPPEPDEHYLVTEPGEYPDVLEPITGDTVSFAPGRWEALWIDVMVDDVQLAGEHELTVRLSDPSDNAVAADIAHTLRLQVHPYRLPDLQITNTHWFHADSLSIYYDVEVLSERHWELIEAFLRSAREMDVNSVLTPTWTPPLDTAEGHTRPCVQLVGIHEADGEYRFDFTKLDRWLDICGRVGMTSIEVAHLFTQWGARCTPRIQVRTPSGVEDRFGWHVEATSPEYRRLLAALIPALRSHLAQAWSGRVLWHISDEPNLQHLSAYEAAKAQVSDLLQGAEVVDALSSFEFAQQGFVDTPIVATDHVRPFLEAGLHPWVYYCVAQDRDVANRFIALPSVRNRVLGRQLFVHRAPGFLHWGFNFWWTQFALRPIDPFEETCAGGAFFGGDAFAVYPGPDGTPWVSLRHRVFAQGMADHRALSWLASLTDHRSAASLVDEGGALAYSRFSYDVEQHLRDRRAVDEAILAALAKQAG